LQNITGWTSATRSKFDVSVRAARQVRAVFYMQQHGGIPRIIELVAKLTYQQQLRTLLSPDERRVISKLNSPKKIQDFLEALPQNFPSDREGILPPAKILKERRAHCIEGAVLAATSLAYHGREPLLMDLQAADDDDDHVVALFKEGKYWGAISKTNHPVLRWRDPIYASVRELAMSYFHEYFLWKERNGKLMGKKTLRTYSKPFDLRRYKPERYWNVKDLDWLAEDLDVSPHYPMVPKGMQKFLRNATKIETVAMEMTEWPEPGKKARKGL
jgi:hypothetical protein